MIQYAMMFKHLKGFYIMALELQVELAGAKQVKYCKDQGLSQMKVFCDH